ncbi:MAG TPA: MFS transporter [Candidatus Dormibacteraeota bacterium]|jgi:hypothetical protein|nr:MFS transporter [Candidatus Dormibacteraeota bacterium]
MPAFARRTQSPYRAALSTPGALAFYVTAVPGRLGIAMTGLGLIWLVHRGSGSFAAAGVVGGAFAVAEAVAGPQVARVIDRFGQTRVLPACVAIHAAAIAALILAVLHGVPTPAEAAIAMIAGAALPEIGALSAARWSWLLEADDVLPSAFALEALSNEIAFLIGPVLVSGISTLVDPIVGSALAAGLIVLGGAGLALQPGTAPPAGPAAAISGSRQGLLVDPAFAVLIAVNLLLGILFGAFTVSTTAFAVVRGRAGLAGPLNGLMSATGIAGGWLYGRRRWRSHPWRQLGLALAMLAVCCLPVLVLGSLPGLGLTLLAGGLFLAPAMVQSSVLTRSVVERSRLTQAFTWLSSASAAGSGLGTAIAARTAESLGGRGGFALAAAAIALAAISTGVAGRAGWWPRRLDAPR